MSISLPSFLFSLLASPSLSFSVAPNRTTPPACISVVSLPSLQPHTHTHNPAAVYISSGLKKDIGDLFIIALCAHVHGSEAILEIQERG